VARACRQPSSANTVGGSHWNLAAEPSFCSHRGTDSGSVCSESTIYAATLPGLWTSSLVPRPPVRSCCAATTVGANVKGHFLRHGTSADLRDMVEAGEQLEPVAGKRVAGMVPMYVVAGKSSICVTMQFWTS